MAAITEILPNNYSKNLQPYLYKIPVGIETSFFINSGTPLTSTTDLSIGIFDGLGVLQQSVSPSFLAVTGGFRAYVVNMVLNVASNTVYIPVLYNTSTNAVVQILNKFECVPSSDIGFYARVSYRNSTNIFNFNYEELPTFRNVIYLDLNRIDNQPEYDFNNVSEVGSGLQRNVKSQVKNFVTLQSFLFDQIAHLGMAGLSLHDDIEINFKPYEVKTGYEVETNIRRNTNYGTIELYDQELNTINLHG